MSAFLSAVIATSVVTAVGIGAAFVVHQRRLGRHRGLSREDFVGAFTETRIPVEITRAVYDYYKGQVIFKEFRVSPDDDYEDVLSKGDQDIDDDARLFMKILGLKIPPNYAAVRSETRIRTLRDMVLWLHWIHQQQRA